MYDTRLDLAGMKAYRKAWQAGSIAKPLIILIGGNNGAGKSTLAEFIEAQLGSIKVIPTPLMRTVVRTVINEKDNPLLFVPTYTLHQWAANDEAVRKLFHDYCAPIQSVITGTVDFLAQEQQQYIIEGNHVVPWTNYASEKCNVIELYLYIDDEVVQARAGGPTHNRQHNDQEVHTIQNLQTYIVTEAERAAKQTFNCTHDFEEVLRYLDGRLAELAAN